MRQFIDIVHLLLERFDLDQFLSRLNGVMELVRRGATEGERGAAREAFDRMMQRARDEVARMRQPDSGVTTAEVERFLRSIERLKTGSSHQQEKPKAKPQPESRPLYKVGQWVVVLFDGDDRVGKVRSVHHLGKAWYYDVLFPNGNGYVTNNIIRPATQDEIDAAMASRAKTTTGDFEILKFARYIDPEENSNKVYGVVRRSGNIYVFWGGFQKALKVKMYPDFTSANVQFRIKERRGYAETDPSRYQDWIMRALKVEFAKRSGS